MGKKIHMVNWDSVCKPKFLGGLGIKKATTMNKAMLAKTSWRMLQKDEGLWCDVFKSKYLKHSSLMDDSYKKLSACSSTWNSVCYGASLLRNGLTWRIGNGASALFWKDRWSGAGILKEYALDSSLVDNDLVVQDFWSNNDWDKVLLVACLPLKIVEQITCIPISTNGLCDRLIWTHTANGKFSVKSAYLSTMNETSRHSNVWKLIWGLTPPS